MIIKRLQIFDFRVLDRFSLEAGPGPNLIWGDNGTGKTSVLEAIYLAGRGRSFRHRESGPFIRRDCQSTRVVLSTQNHMGHVSTLGIERGRRAITLRLDGRNLSKRSELLRALPVQLITPQSHELLERGPEMRRRFLDFGMFHVEPQFHRLQLDLSRVLRQRNAALRSQPRTVGAWDEQFASLAKSIHGLRTDYLTRLEPGIHKVLFQLMSDIEVSIAYRPGWDEAVPLVRALEKKLPVDLKRGFTSLGPQRAEIDFQVQGNAAAKSLSRGQQKLLVSALQFAQAQLMAETADESPVMLIDDLPAELDVVHRQRLVDLIEHSGLQCFVTAIEPDMLKLGKQWEMFHVEQKGGSA